MRALPWERMVFMRKLLFTLALAFLLVLALGTTAMAAGTDDALASAETLHELGLFQGTGTNADGTPIYDLEKVPTRNQALIMLIRLLGKEEEAKAGTWEIPFTDVSEGMRPYVGYAYANGLTKGYSAEKFGGGQAAKDNQYIAFLLRALGYESGADFTVSRASELSDALNITSGQYQQGMKFTRGDVAQLSVSALYANVKGTETTMMAKLQTEGVVPAQAETPTPPSYLRPEDAAPEGLEFREIPYEYPYVCLYGYVPDYFSAERFEYAVDGEDVYFRIYFSSETVGEFFVTVGNSILSPKGTYLGELAPLRRYAADAESGVFTCKIERELLEQYFILYLGPSEDYKQSPDYAIQVGYFLTYDGEEPQFQEETAYQDDSYEAPDFQFESLEYAEVVGGRLYRMNFTNGIRRTVQLWLSEQGSSEGWKYLPGGFIRTPEPGDTSVVYFVPNCVWKTDLEVIHIRIRDNDYDGSCPDHGYVDIYLNGEIPGGNGGPNGFD